MKKKIIFLFLMIFSSLLLVNAKEFYFINENNVSLTKTEYDFIVSMFYDGYQNFITPSDYNIIFADEEISIQKIEEKTIETFNYFRATYHETQSKYFTIKKSCSNNCLITLVAKWKNNPSIRSYDVIGARLDGVTLASTPNTSAANTSSSNSSLEMVSNNNGFGVSVKLPTGGSNMYVSQYFRVSTGGSVYGSYQHATATISLANSKKYNISSSGYGEVFLFQSSIRKYYDGMSGVNVSV